MKRITYLILVCFLLFTTKPTLFSQSEQFDLRTCKAELEKDELIIENNFIKRIYQWNNGLIIAKEIVNKATGEQLIEQKKQPETLFSGLQLDTEGTFEKLTIENSKLFPDHLLAEVIFAVKGISYKTVFRIYPNSPAIATDHYVKINDEKAKSNWPTQPHIIEDVILNGRHWKLNVVEFFDDTDKHNNLVFETSVLPFKHSLKMKGNIIFANNQVNGDSFFLIKEAPCSFVQLNYPGFDFDTKILEGDYTNIAVSGLGIASEDLLLGEWMKGYGSVFGVCGNTEVEQLIALRKYQQQVRKYNPERDEMIMMNTWGDRGQDGKINEAFCLAEIEAAAKLSVTHFQIDNGWQLGVATNSVFANGSLDNIWDNPDYWMPHPDKFPNGFKTIIDKGNELGVEVCLWYNPSADNNYAHWEEDGRAMIRLYNDFGIRIFKIDGVKQESKKAEMNLRKMYNMVLANTNDEAVFNVDVTAGIRNGYHYFNEYGNIFLENRYTDWCNYYPHWTLRNLWMLSKYVPAQVLQIEFLNIWRKQEKYADNDPLAPVKIPFEYTFATTMMGQPLAWFEGTGLPGEAFEITPVMKKYKAVQADIHAGVILPIGEEPTGASWTGFQSMNNEKGYLMIFREMNENSEMSITTYLEEGKEVEFEHILGTGEGFSTTVGENGKVSFTLPEKFSYGLYSYNIK